MREESKKCIEKRTVVLVRAAMRQGAGGLVSSITDVREEPEASGERAANSHLRPPRVLSIFRDKLNDAEESTLFWSV